MYNFIFTFFTVVSDVEKRHKNFSLFSLTEIYFFQMSNFAFHCILESLVSLSHEWNGANLIIRR